MRRVKRLPLGKKAVAYLGRCQKNTNRKAEAGVLDIEKEWKSARKTQTMQAVLKTLQKMMGSRERCMYCLDSHGSDIEHFRPKALHHKRMFRWRNLLLCCTECGRLKGNRFPTDGKRPLLIDPTKEEPWEHLDFIPETGHIKARFDPRINAWSPKGEKTVETLHLDRREALEAGYLKTLRRLSRIIDNFLENPSFSASHLLESLSADDEHGLLGWIFIGTGQHHPPFKDLREQHPLIWEKCMADFSINR
ncbi:TIGR02646 family protein [Methylomagnum ishizawai]|uniref:TIGR02646 family protein n=1 Tax=Methylomagnum ishizawai TaxID=1760988 RepID=A0A1Y6CVW5_9GAMM|nr:hypothetical protein [Methylomagnum ishizawai]SMF94788.1 TIGR02646 family protein [Methylomagnum ishizawai]